MIVVSQALVLALAAAAQDGDLPIIGWQNLATVANLTADTEDTSYPDSNLANPSTAEKWVAADNSEQYVTVIINSVEEIDYLGIVGHNLGSAGIEASVEGQATSAAAFAELAGSVLLANDDPLLFRFEPQSLYAIRLRMRAGDAAPEAAVLYTGKLLVMERGLSIEGDFTPISFGAVPNIVTGVSETGNFLGRIVLGETSFSEAMFRWLAPDWYRENFEPFAETAKQAPFFFAWAPESYPRDIGFCWSADGRPIPKIDPVTRRMHVDLKMAGIA